MLAAHEPAAGPDVAVDPDLVVPKKEDVPPDTQQAQDTQANDSGNTGEGGGSSTPANTGSGFLYSFFVDGLESASMPFGFLLQNDFGVFAKGGGGFSLGSSVHLTGAIDKSDSSSYGPVTHTSYDYGQGTESFDSVILLPPTVPVNKVPVAGFDFFSGVYNHTLSGNLLVDNGYGADSDPEGDAVHALAGSYATLHGGSVDLLADGGFVYTPAVNYVGADSFTYSVADDHGGTGSASASFFMTNTNNYVKVDFSGATVDAYGDGNDFDHLYAIEDGGNTLHLTGNTWVSINFDYVIQAGTVIEFDFKSTSQGEIHGIGLDKDSATSDTYSFELYGTQIWGLQAFHTYAAHVGEWVHYTITVGASYTGTFDRMFFINDDDVDASGDGFFSNVEIYGGTLIDTGSETNVPFMNFDGVTLHSYGINQDFTPTVAQASGTQVELYGNTWKAIDFTYTVTDNTVMQFDFLSTDRGELHGIGLDTDYDHNNNKFVQIYGTDSFGQDGPDYTTPGSAQTFVLELSKYYTVGTTYSHMTFVADDDASATAESIFDHIIVYERGSSVEDVLHGTAQSQTMLGLAGDDILYGGGGDDRLYGGAGTDFLYGEDGADTFVFESASAFGAVDHVMDFDVAQGDALDISDILTGYDPVTDLLSDFVRTSESNGDTIVAVDADGGGDHFASIAILHGVTGLGTPDTLEDLGALITV